MPGAGNEFRKDAPVSTVTAPAATLSSVDLGIVAVIALLLILVVREVGSTGMRSRRRHPGLPFLLRTWNAPILALLVVFVVILALRILQVLE